MPPTSTRVFAAFALVCSPLVGLSCRSAAPLAGAAARIGPGTLTGRVTAPGGAAPARGYVVEVTSLEDGALYSARTTSTGHFSLEVPPGRYRLTVVLGDGEELAEAPEHVEVKPGGLVMETDLVVRASGY